MPDSQTLGLFVAAMVAGVICFRLYTVLGRRTGEEPEPRPRPAPLAPAVPAAPEPIPTSGGLLDIQLADRTFDTPKFLAGARDAYGQIVNAFQAADRSVLHNLLSPEVYEAFDTGITQRTTAPPRLVKLTDARIVGSCLHGRIAQITVAFVAEFENGQVTDVWTFERNLDNVDPNWTLIATSGDIPE